MQISLEMYARKSYRKIDVLEATEMVSHYEW